MKNISIWSKSLIFDINRRIFDINWPFLNNLVRIWLISVRIRIKIVATIERTAGIESQKSIKSRFKYDLDRIFGRPPSNHISLPHIQLLMHSIFFKIKKFEHGLIKNSLHLQKSCFLLMFLLTLCLVKVWLFKK